MKIGTLLDTKAALPDWRDHPKLKEPAEAVAAARAAIDRAQARLDGASALIVALDAELALISDLRAANAIEDRRDAAIKEEADAKRELERATRAVERALKSFDPVALAAKRETAAALKAE